ncbi:hypothetical protein [Aerosakkonema funiforme]|uniref:hypothetical protein n=1 Tax=Aerosakkonema funiforme TaxID=1246630 RepID=UPI0035B8FFB0
MFVVLQLSAIVAYGTGSKLSIESTKIIARAVLTLRLDKFVLSPQKRESHPKKPDFLSPTKN